MPSHELPLSPHSSSFSPPLATRIGLMGNAHSSETPRKAPQKLSKPRTTQRASNANDLQPTEPAHFSNSYPVGRPLSAAQPTSSPNVLRHSLTGLSEAPSEGSRSPVDRSKERERRLSGIVRSNTSIHEYGPRHSMVAASIHSLEYQSRTRANSMVYVAGSRSFTGDRTIRSVAPLSPVLISALS